MGTSNKIPIVLVVLFLMLILCGNSEATAKYVPSDFASIKNASSISPISHNSHSSPVIHVKFSAGTDLEDPMKLIPSELKDSVIRIRRLTTLADEQLDKIGASHFKRWFEITLKPGMSLESVIKELKSLDYIDVVEQAPRPAPPP